MLQVPSGVFISRVQFSSYKSSSAGWEHSASTLIKGDVYSQAELSDKSFSAVGACVGFGLEPLRRWVALLPVRRFICSETGCSRVLRRALIPEDQNHHIESL